MSDRFDAAQAYDTPRMAFCRKYILGVAVAVSCCTGWSARADDPPISATPVLEYRCADAPAMHLPTSVAAMAFGRIFVADGLNDRILHFDPHGTLIQAITQVGDQSLSRPIAVRLDSDDQLWIADTGHARVVVRAEDASLVRILTPNVAGERPIDLTDVAPTADGKAAWMVDNDNHRLIRVELESGATTVIGRLGESLGQLNHPFMMALTKSGDVLVSDVINARVSQFNASGAPARSISTYGVELGQLYRPKGVACDKDGNIWVSDSVLGVIQVFNADGGLIDVLRDGDGKVLRLDGPMGMDFDAEDHVYVVESTADRVRKFKIKRGPKRPTTPVPKSAEVTGAMGRSCTVCHMEMIEPLSKGVATAIAQPPVGDAKQPAVSRAETCLSCHDGSVIDSRRRVWELHGHRTGVAPPADMKVPDNLPLVDGKLACRTCHSAHGGGNFSGDLRTSVFLRVENKASELCISCHQDKTRGPKLGTHPIGGMPWPVPQALIDDGAKVGPNPRELTCQVCHTPHGAKNDHLLVRGTESNQLCLACHDQMRPGMFRDGPHTEHPISPRVDSRQEDAVQAMGTKLGPDNHLICLSCHKLHHGKGERFMLADDLADGKFCIRCHQEKTGVVGTQHDLRTNFPQEKNRLGMTAQSGGPCSACHMFHRYARAPEESALDPGGGKCITCHQAGRCAEKRVLGSVNHPKSKCLDCHNPHTQDHTKFLRDEAVQICAQCHGDQGVVSGGSHDMMRGTGSWPAESTATRDMCLACHRPHGNEDTGLFRMAGSVGGVDAGCRGCHAAQSWGAKSDQAAVHPATKPKASTLPMATDNNGATWGIGCITCHDPHAGKSSPRLLRMAKGAPAENLCLTCHTDQNHVALTGHGGASLAQAGVSAEACGPCHAVHANPATTDLRTLRPKAVNSTRAPGEDVMSAACTACHRPNGPARPPAVAVHPAIVIPLSAGAGTSNSLPLFDDSGAPSATGRIACQTCHTPHGNATQEELTRVAGLPIAERKAVRLLVRDFAPPNVCTGCHGQDALRRFLYFHDPVRRAGPIESPTAGRVRSSRAAAVGP